MVGPIASQQHVAPYMRAEFVIGFLLNSRGFSLGSCGFHFIN